jgi:hypothetical protein
LRQILLGGRARWHVIGWFEAMCDSWFRFAKRWARQSAKYSTPESATSLVAFFYAGNAFTPSLDEAIQEGILGLVRAADRYDPSRGLRFSTYCTYWITNFVRNSFTNVPSGTWW